MKHACSICGYVYDDAKEKVPFSELPDDWKCPWCGAAKSDFEPIEDQPEPKATTAATAAPIQAEKHHEELQKLTVGQLSALCSNLARGCEKQYKTEESELFSQLAAYLKTVSPAQEDATVEAVAERLKAEIAYYPEMRETAHAAGDRGAERVCVWGEKVTRMLSSLVGRYLKDGEAMLADTDIWICTVCGFVYVGNQAPELCPVCKVPAWKFEKIDGR